ncbi:MAG: phenylacetate--CoA ligase [Planctomycetia bacterium]|nr:phenylacetate--CoA ligase [Planctomycetia bacterium]
MSTSNKRAPVTHFHPISSPDYVPLEQLRELQSRRLAHMARRAYENVPLYRERMQAKGVTPDDIQSIDDISKLPFTMKCDLRDTYPYGLFASPLKDIVRLHASSGTTGKPIVVAYTKEDLSVWDEVVARALAGYGLTKNDIIQNSFGYGLFTGGLGLHGGIERLGALAVPVSGGNTERQILLMKDFGVTAISCTPSYFVHLIDKAQQMGLDIREFPLRVGIFGAEPWTEAMRAHMEDAAGIRAYNIYGLSEIVGPGVGSECWTQEGMHIFEDHFYPEIINPQTGETLPDGEEGELVLSTLSKEAMPMLRYRTRDITTIERDTCPCGRTIRRIRRISRRSDDMLIIRGVNVFPSQIETGILRVEGTLPHFQILLTRSGGLDQMEVRVEVNADVLGDTIASIEGFKQKVAQSIENIIGLHIRVTPVTPHTLKRSEGKINRVVDLRNEGK